MCNEINCHMGGIKSKGMIIMPRIARSSLGTSFFHVIVQGINKEYIYDKKEYIEKYLELINKKKEEYNIQILAYCIMSNHAHLLIYAEDYKQMAKFMHKINCIYAQYYNNSKNRVGVLFRNRYVSEPIYREDYLLNCINYIHMNPVKANMVNKCSEYKYSSYNQFIKNEGIAKNNILTKIFGEQNWKELFDLLDDNTSFKDMETDKENAMNLVIQQFESEVNKSLEEIVKNDKILLRKLIMILKENYKIPYTQIAKKVNISRGKLQSFLKK